MSKTSHSDPVDLKVFGAKVRDLNPQAPWVLAVSGGSDSVALMHLAARWADRMGKPCPHVVTVNHGLRAEAAAEADLVRAWAHALGLPHTILTWDGPKPTSDIQAQARAIRYRLIADYCLDKGLTSVMVAHTQDDQAETFLLRLARGSGVTGLSGMAASGPLPLTEPHYKSIRLLRPLLSFRRDDLRARLRTAGQDWIEDPSNEDVSFARVRMRALMPALAKEGLTVSRLATTTDRLSDVSVVMGDVVRDLKQRCAHFASGGYVSLDGPALMSAPSSIGLKVLAELLMAVSGSYYQPRFAALERLYEALAGDVSDPGALGQGRTLSGCHIGPAGSCQSYVIAREMRSLRARLRGSNAPSRLGVGESVVWDNRMELVLTGSEQALVSWRGDIRPLGRDGWRELTQRVARSKQDTLTHIPVKARTGLPGLWYGDDLVGALPYGIVNPAILPKNLTDLPQFKARAPWGTA